MRSIWTWLTGKDATTNPDNGPRAWQDQDAGDAEHLARRLEALQGYRVLRALNVEGGVDCLRPCTPGERIAVVVDSETTGLDAENDRLVEIAAQRFIIGVDGRIAEIERVRSWLEDPGRPMPERLTLLTGLCDDDLRSLRFDDGAISTMIGGADLVIAHNAAFDRPFIEKRFPMLERLAWGCSLTQLDWLALGYDGRSLGHIVLQAGWFFQGHRAGNDVVALTSLLGLSASDGRTILAHLLARCETNSVRIDAVGSPFDSKDRLKAAGYRWDSAKRCWWREVDPADLAHETAWLDEQIYQGRGQPRLRAITARERFTRQV